MSRKNVRREWGVALHPTLAQGIRRWRYASNSAAAGQLFETPRTRRHGRGRSSVPGRRLDSLVCEVSCVIGGIVERVGQTAGLGFDVILARQVFAEPPVDLFRFPFHVDDVCLVS